MSMDRRQFVGSAVASVFTLPLGASAQPAPNADGMKVLVAKAGTLNLPGAGADLKAIGYDGQIPGPLLRYKKGEEVKIRLTNQLDKPTAIHWQGVRNANAFDGVPGLTQQPVSPGMSFDYRFTPPDSGLFMYRPVSFAGAQEQVERGLYGLLIVDEAEPPQVDKDMVVLLDDWFLDDKGAVSSALPRAAGAKSVLTVTSQMVPRVEVLQPGARVRLRLASVAQARAMVVSFVGVKPFICAIDGQPCDPFEPVRQTIPMGPGSRFDLQLDLPMEKGAVVSLVLRGEPDTMLVTFKTEGEPKAARGPIVTLGLNPALPPAIKLQEAKKLDLVLDGAGEVAKGLMIGMTKAAGLGDKPLFTVKRGTGVSMGFTNKLSLHTQFHVHGHHMRLLHDMDDGWEPYWRDSVLVPATRTKRVAFLADNPGKWAISCQVLGGAGAEFVTWFEVV